MGEGDDLTQKAETCHLDAKYHEEYGKQKGRAATNRMAHEKPLHKKIRDHEKANQQKAKPHRAKEA